MPVMLALRIGLLLAGVVAFTIALRSGHEWIRWVGIALVGGALALRPVKRGS